MAPGMGRESKTLLKDTPGLKQEKILYLVHLVLENPQWGCSGPSMVGAYQQT